jgi:hypothetical protein
MRASEPSPGENGASAPIRWARRVHRERARPVDGTPRARLDGPQSFGNCAGNVRETAAIVGAEPTSDLRGKGKRTANNAFSACGHTAGTIESAVR